MDLRTRLDRLHARAVAFPGSYALMIVSRALLAIGFFAPGLHKAIGKRFHSPEILTVETEVGFWFEAFYRTGAYYGFVGVMQMVAAILLLIPRTALLGALLYLPIIANIFVLTASMPFAGTPFVTGAMLVACLYLICWDYPRWSGILPWRLEHPTPRRWPLDRLPARLAYWAGIACAVVLTIGGRNLGAREFVRWSFFALLAVAAFVLIDQIVLLARRGLSSKGGRREEGEPSVGG